MRDGANIISEIYFFACEVSRNIFGMSSEIDNCYAIKFLWISGAIICFIASIINSTTGLILRGLRHCNLKGSGYQLES